MGIYLHQIYYDEESRSKLDAGFIPLDNSNSERPDWFEFWPIKKYLNETKLDDNSWYGFFSPRFQIKTGFTSDYVKQVISQYKDNGEIALFSSTWDFIAYFKNVFEQGEEWHDGLTEAAQSFYRDIGHPINLHKLVNYSQNSVTSNYFVAKPRFWRRWLYFGERLFAMCEQDNSSNKILGKKTTYGERFLPMKVFVQERIATVMLSTERFAVIVPDQTINGKLFDGLFFQDIRTKKLLIACDLLKSQYVLSQDVSYLEMYEKIRSLIKLKPHKFK
jgi:hypothetical protein